MRAATPALRAAAARPSRQSVYRSVRRSMAAAAASAAAPPPEEGKTIYLIRHGVTEMNVYLSINNWASASFKDPLLYDTKLTREGEKQLLVSSPLRRALRTAELAFAAAPPPPALPRLVTPLCRERLYHSSDVGRAPAILAAEHPTWGGFDELDPIWWHSNGDDDPLAHPPEPEDVFLERVSRFRAWLAARPEPVIAVVSHWGVLDALTQLEFANCELRSFPLQRLRVRAPQELVPPG